MCGCASALFHLLSLLLGKGEGGVAGGGEQREM